MIGLSVSFCIRDIVDGTIPLNSVEKIIGGIVARTDREIDKLIEQYCNSYWSKYPEKAENVFRQLLAEGKIKQPRLVNDRHFPNIGNHKIWVETEEEIIWND